MIFSYNKEHVGDVLLVVVADDQGKENFVEQKQNIAKITTEEKVVAWNIFQVSQIVGPIHESGRVTLSEEQLIALNEIMKQVGFNEQLENDSSPKLVIGYVKSCKKHPDSNHLSITQTEVDHGEVLQIVCGAPNIKAGQKVVVAKPGAMMPDGLIIWPGMLRGVESCGMICSAKELELENASEKKGILELPFDAQVGQPFLTT